MTPPIKLAVGLPAYGRTIVADQAKTWLSLGTWLESDDYRSWIRLHTFITTNICGVERARNFLLAHAMTEGADWLLMIDSDVWVDRAEQLLDMIDYGRRYDAAIIAAEVRTKGGRPSSFPLSLGMKVVRSVDMVSTAIMAINLAKIGAATFRFTDELSEDFEFCRQVRVAERGKIFCDGRLKTYHLDRAAVMES